MPELPDVEGFRRTLASCARGRRIERVERADPGVLHEVSARRLRRELEGHRLAEPSRHGKWLLAPTDGPVVLLHFGMTGRLLCCPADEPPHPHDRIVLALGDEQLRYRDQRKLQGLWLAEDETAAGAMLRGQGPDALELDRRRFEELLSGRRARIKSVLTDQSVLAGLGNLLADEILWHARLHPARRAEELSEDERRRLHSELRRVLQASVREGRVPPGDDWLTGHRNDAEPYCPRCGGPLHRKRIAGRSTVWCPHCQPAPD